jgi:hypothetical protein
MSENGFGFEVFTKEGICRFVPMNGCFVFNVNDKRYPINESQLALPTMTENPSHERSKPDEGDDHRQTNQRTLKFKSPGNLSENHPTINDLTVKNYRDKLNRDEVKRLQVVEYLFHAMGQPGLQAFRRALTRQNMEHNRVQVTSRDWDNYLRIFGVPPTVVKGRLVRQQPPKIGLIDLAIKHAAPEITLHGDLMFVGDLAFFTCISDDIDYITVYHIESKGKKDLRIGMEHTCRAYQSQGFKAVEMFFDGESGMTKLLLDASDRLILNECAIKQSNRGDHVPKIERAIRNLKERIRCIGLGLEYKVNATIMVYLAKHASNCINVLPKKNKFLAPIELFTGRRIQFSQYTSAKFGDLYYVPIANQKTNDMKARAVSAICLGAVLDVATPGTFAFYTLQTRKVMYRTQFVHQIMHEVAVVRLNKLADGFKQEFIAKDSQLDRQLLDDDSSSSEDSQSSDSDDEVDNDGDKTPSRKPVVHKALQRIIDEQNTVSLKRKADVLAPSVLPSTSRIPTADSTVSFEDNSHHSGGEGANRRGVLSTGSITNGTKLKSALKKPRLTALAMRPENECAVTSDEALLHNDPIEMIPDSDRVGCFPFFFPFDTGQLGQPWDSLPESESEEFVCFSFNSSSTCVFSEHSPPFPECDGTDTDAQTDGRSANIQESSVKDQQDSNDLVFHKTSEHGETMALFTYDKSETDKLTVSPFITSALLVMLAVVASSQLSLRKAIEAWPDRAGPAACAELEQLHNKGVVDFLDFDSLSPRDKQRVLRTLMFIKIKRDQRVKARLCMDGRLQALYLTDDFASPTVSTESVLATATIDAHERRIVVCVDIEGAYLAVDMVGDTYGMFDEQISALWCRLYPNDVKWIRNGKLYFRLRKALYGCVQSALLFYQHLRNTLENFGFVTNPYDPCVFTRDFNGAQCTICTHVDDLKISCVNGEAIEQVLIELQRVYKKLAIHRGLVHDYLGMEFDYSIIGKVSITMRKSIEETLVEHDVPQEVCSTPASVNLFKIDEKSAVLDKANRERFHSTVAKLLYIAKHGRPDILLSISFLCTRVTAPTVQDDEKLMRVLKYLRGTKELVLTLEADNLHVVDAYIDASFATHVDMKGHTGTYVTMGKGAVIAKSSKQKIVCKSSTEAELVGLSDSLTPVIWLRNLLGALGYTMDASIVHQDNMSTIHLSEKGRSTSQRTRHMNIKYFYVKDRIDKKEVKVIYTPTEQMIADFFTKPLQGKLFFKFRDLVMNNTTTSIDKVQGCVDKQ